MLGGPQSRSRQDGGDKNCSFFLHLPDWVWRLHARYQTPRPEMNHLKEEEREESGILTDSTENKATEQEIQKEEQKE